MTGTTEPLADDSPASLRNKLGPLKKCLSTAALGISGALSLLAPAAAAPQNCANKFVGVWVATTPLQRIEIKINPDGTAQCLSQKVGSCEPQPGWTCAGNVITYGGSAITLSGDGAQMSHKQGTALVVWTRKGGPADLGSPANQTGSQETGCSDITGLDGGGASSPCPNAKKGAAPASPATTPQDKPQPDAASKSGAPTVEEQLALIDQLGKVLAPYNIAPPVAKVEPPLTREKFTPVPDTTRDANLRHAEGFVRAGEALENNDPTCRGLSNAAANYLNAAWFFLRADAVKKVDAILLRHDALVARVDRAKAEKRCYQPRAVPKARNAESAPEKINDDTCDAALKSAQAFAAAGANMRTIDAEPTSENPNQFAAEQLLSELAAKGCRDPDAKPLGPEECRKMRVRWLRNGVRLDDARVRIAALGCPPAN